MSGITTLFGIGTSALFAFQRALAVTGQNVANVQTPGYSRQEAILSEAIAQDGTPGQIGTGVQVTEIRRALNTFVERQLLASREQLGRFQASRDSLAVVQGLFGDSNDLGIGASLNEFFNAVQDVVTNPSDVTARSVLLSKAATLAARFNQAASDLHAQRQALDAQVGQTIAEINTLASQIAELNTKINVAETAGQRANDLRDQRGRLLNELAERIEVSVIEDATGQVTVFVGRGQALVEKGDARRLVGTASPGNNGLLDVQYEDVGGTLVTISPVISSGRLKGLLDVRDSNIPDLLTALDTLADTLVTEVNRQHGAGYDLDGNTGQDFFSPSGLTAATISVAITDPRAIAASDTAAGIPGNNANALALAALKNRPLPALGDATLSRYYSTAAANLGTVAQAAERDLTAQQIVHEQLEAHRAEASAVSLDEELVNMIKYQRAFQAASRLIVLTDELMQTILGLKR